ncbi:hypothetical protein [Polaromonas sp.]|nr:hypothetical protein [Polaromonas sp.]
MSGFYGHGCDNPYRLQRKHAGGFAYDAHSDAQPGHFLAASV